MFGLMQVTVLPTGLEGLAQAMQGLGFSVGQHLNRENIQRRQLARNEEARQNLAFEGEQLARAIQQGTAPIETEFGIAPATKGVDPENAKLLAAKKIAESRDMAVEVVLETMGTTPLTLEQQTELAARDVAAQSGETLPNLAAMAQISELRATTAEGEQRVDEAGFRESYFESLKELGVGERQAWTTSQQVNLEGRDAEVALEFLNRWKDVMDDLEGVQRQHALQALRNPQFLAHLDRRAGMRTRALASSAADAETPFERFESQVMLNERLQNNIQDRFDEWREIDEEGESFDGQKDELRVRLNHSLDLLKQAADMGFVPVSQAQTFIAELEDNTLWPDSDAISVYWPSLDGNPEMRSQANQMLADAANNYSELGPFIRDMEAAARAKDDHPWNHMGPGGKEQFRLEWRRIKESPSGRPERERPPEPSEFTIGGAPRGEEFKRLFFSKLEALDEWLMGQEAAATGTTGRGF